MRVAIFSDIHGNLIALEKFVQSTRGAVDTYLCLGDVVNYGPWNDECLEIICQLPAITVLEGNHERLFNGMDDVSNEIPLVQDFFRCSRPLFSRLDLIADLIQRTNVGAFECTHTIEGRAIYRDTTIEIGHDYIIGHTHHQFQIDRCGFTIVNPGSVGQNRQYIDMVDYSILDTVKGRMYMHSLPYDVDLFLSELHSKGYPKHCVAYYANKSRKLP